MYMPIHWNAKMIAEEIWNGAWCEKHSAPKLWGQTNAFAQSWSTVGIHKTGKLPRWERATGTEMNEGIIVATFPEVNRYLNAQNYSLGVKADLKTLSKFVREELFYVFVHDFKNDEDDCNADRVHGVFAFPLEGRFEDKLERTRKHSEGLES